MSTIQPAGSTGAIQRTWTDDRETMIQKTKSLGVCLNTRSLAILDIDGTLTDTVPTHLAALHETMQAFDFPALNTDWSSYRHHTDRAILIEAFENAGWGAPSEADWAQFSDGLVAAFDRRRLETPIRPIEGAVDFVKSIQEAGWMVAFATGSLRPLARLKLEAAGIPFDENRLFTSSEHVTRDDLVNAAIAASRPAGGAHPNNIVSVGDGLWDLRTAQNLGLGFLGVGRGASAALLASLGACVTPDLTNAVQLCGEMRGHQPALDLV